MALADSLHLQLLKLYPQRSPHLLQKYAAKYTRAVLEELRAAFLRPINDDPDELSVSAQALHRACGQIGTQPRQRLFDFMSQSTHTSLVLERYRGNQGRYKRVSINPIYKEQIMQELTSEQAPARTSPEAQRDIDQNFTDIIPIDTLSLASFIQRCQQPHTNTNPRYQERISRNLIIALDTQSRVESRDGVNFVREVWRTADTGRRYGQYVSLQRVPREVRLAALGPCHRYDGQAHSFAVLASLARHFDPEIKIAAIEDYIRRRDRVRQTISQVCGVSEERIKAVFTALGFGARPVANPYMAIRRTLGSDLAYNKLILHPEFNYIRSDLELVNSTVLKNFPEGDFELLGLTYTSRDPESGRLKNKNRRLAWIYQRLESVITEEFVRYVGEQTGQVPLLTVHDAVYYREPIPTSVYLGVHDLIRNQHCLSLVKFAHDALWPTGTDGYYERLIHEQDSEAAQHRAHIQAEAQASRGYRSEFFELDQGQTQPTLQWAARISGSQKADVGDYEYEYEYEYELDQAQISAH